MASPAPSTPPQHRYPWALRRHGSGTRCSRHVSPPRFPNSASPSLHRVPVTRVPRLRRYYERLRRPNVPPTALRCLRLVVPAVAPVFAPDHPTPVVGPGALGVAAPRHLSAGDAGISQVPGEPNVPMPCSLTPAGPTSPGHCGGSAWPPFTARRRLPHCGNFGAQSHGLGTSCLRFARWVTHIGRKTRFWLLAKLYQAGLFTRRVPRKVSEMYSLHHFPLSQASLAQAAYRMALPSGRFWAVFGNLGKMGSYPAYPTSLISPDGSAIRLRTLFLAPG